MSTFSPYENKDLFLRIANGDEQAFTEIFHIYTPKLLPYIIKIARKEQLAEEMVQETFLRLWINRAKLAQVDQPSSWLFRVASNVTVTYLKTQLNRKRLLTKVQVEEEEDTVSQKIHSKELVLLIQHAINLLPEKRQEIYRLSREAGLTHQQIADQLGISINTVKNQLGMALKFMQEHISKETGLTLLTISIILPVI